MVEIKDPEIVDREKEFIADEIHQVLARRHAALLWLTVDHDLYGME